VADKLRLDVGKHYEIFPHYGNTVSASLPLALSLAIDEGRLKRGDRALLMMASAGITTGYAALTY
jgi:3-oxoacyl-[acyl-carrier-protein] synthase-3